MSLAKRYRTRFGAPRGDRLLFYLTTALAIHAGMATAGWVSWQEHKAETAEATASTPIEFIYLDDPDLSTDLARETERLASAETDAAGTRVKNLPINAGKVVTPAKSLQEGKPVELSPQTGQIQPTSYTSTPITAAPAPSPIVADTTTSPDTEEAKAVEPAPAPLPLDDSLVGAIPQLPSLETDNPDGLAFSDRPEALSQDESGAIAATADPPTTPAGPVSGTPLPPPPTIDAAEAEPGDGGEDEVSAQTDASEEDPEATDTIANIESTNGLEGLPNPDRTVSDAPPQIAARREQALGAYVNTMMAEIETAWQRIAVQNSYFPVVRFEISRDGQLQSVALIESSGSEDADQAAVEAVQAAAPFDAFPEEVDDATFVFRLSFNYVVNSSDDGADSDEGSGATSSISTSAEQ